MYDTQMFTSASTATDLGICCGEQILQSSAAGDCGLALYSNVYSLLAISWMLVFFLHLAYNTPQCLDQSSAQHSISTKL